MIPEWLDAETLRWLIIVVMAVLAVGTTILMRVVRRALLRLLLIVAFAGVAISLWQQRADLQSCIDTCSCSLYGQDVAIPASRNPNCG